MFASSQRFAKLETRNTHAAGARRLSATDGLETHDSQFLRRRLLWAWRHAVSAQSLILAPGPLLIDPESNKSRMPQVRLGRYDVVQ